MTITDAIDSIEKATLGSIKIDIEAKRNIDLNGGYHIELTKINITDHIKE